MANPQFIDLNEDEWGLVATAVVAGQVWNTKGSTRYLQTYRQTGEPAPENREDGVPAFIDGDNEPISASEQIDVYLYPLNDSGRVRVDL